MIIVRNEEDIIEEGIEHLLSQGLELVVLDGGSTDGTYEKCKKFAERGLIKLEIFKTKTFDHHEGLIRRAVYDMALALKPDWIIRIDADEFLESGINGMTLKDAITQVDAEGYNLIQFNWFDFCMTDDDNEDAKSVKEKFPYYTYSSDFKYSAWKFSLGIDVEWSPHLPVFPEEITYKIYPKKFPIRHYPYRSKEQVEKKIKGKIRGIDNSKSNIGLPGYTLNLLKHRNEVNKKIDHTILTKYNYDNIWNHKVAFQILGSSNPPKQEEIFSKDGKLRWEIKTINQMKIELSELRRKTLELRLRHKAYGMKMALKKKFLI